MPIYQSIKRSIAINEIYVFTLSRRFSLNKSIYKIRNTRTTKSNQKFPSYIINKSVTINEQEPRNKFMEKYQL